MVSTVANFCQRFLGVLRDLPLRRTLQAGLDPFAPPRSAEDVQVGLREVPVAIFS